VIHKKKWESGKRKERLDFVAYKKVDGENSVIRITQSVTFTEADCLWNVKETLNLMGEKNHEKVKIAGSLFKPTEEGLEENIIEIIEFDESIKENDLIERIKM